MMVGIIMGGVTVFFSQDSPDKKLDKTVEQFVVISDHISELSILAGEPIGLLLEPPDWRENPLDQGWLYRWQKLTREGVWADLEEVEAVDLETEIELAVFIEEQQWKYRDEPKENERVPLVLFYPSGEVTPFEIEFTSELVPGESETVLVDVWGSVTWKERQEQLEEEDSYR